MRQDSARESDSWQQQRLRLELREDVQVIRMGVGVEGWRGGNPAPSLGLPRPYHRVGHTLPLILHVREGA